MTRIILIGAGTGGRALVELLHKDPGIKLVGVADKNERAPGMVLARQLGLPVGSSYRKLLATAAADLIIDVTGDPTVAPDIMERKPAGAELIGGNAARFIWNLIEARETAEVLEDKYHLALRELEAHAESDFIVGANPKMGEIFALIAKVAPTPTTVLVRGESGTGKELVARAIHRHSTLSNHPLVTLNCTALSPSLLESELFGYKRGAFTGAYTDRKGLFEKAHGGTMFLDEIGDMSLETQAKLLRTLQTGEIRAVGDLTTKAVSVRIIAATNQDLEKAIREGRFREDLFYRVNTFTITLPPDLARSLLAFTDSEWALVEDLCDYTLPDFKGDATSPGRLQTRRPNENSRDDTEQYCRSVMRVLRAAFGKDKSISCTVFSESDSARLPVRLAMLHLGGRLASGEVRITRMSSNELLNELRSASQHASPTSGPVVRSRVIRLYFTASVSGELTPTIAVIKPDQVRYWTRSMGLRDGDEIAADVITWGNSTPSKVKSSVH